MISKGNIKKIFSPTGPLGLSIAGFSATIYVMSHISEKK